MQNKKIEIYTDGSCIGNPGPGGWGVLIKFNGKAYKLAGGEKSSTNNRMEMTAMIQALKMLRTKLELSQDELNSYEIVLYSDSNLLIQSLNKGWKRKANTDLWAEMDKSRAWLNIKWVWVKAHDTNKYNNLVDELALAEAKKQKK